MNVAPSLHRIASAWRQRVSTATRQLLFAALVFALFCGAHLARLGSDWARALTALGLVAVVLGFVVRARRERRDWMDLRRTLRRAVVPAQPELGARALRAVTLLERTAGDTTVGSEHLARAHFERVVARVSVDAVESRAEHTARRVRLVMWLLAGSAFACVLVAPARVIEGIDVLVARNGRAPVPLPWLELSQVSVQAPAYLRMADRTVIPGLTARVASGSLVTVRGVPLREGRQLVLSDGSQEVPFVSDGAGGVVARWTLEKDAQLTVAARFGKVLIAEPEVLELKAMPDERPVVVLEGAPKTVELGDVSRVELRYEALDDHGLRQIDLVLRAGGREDRRVLSRLDGSSTLERGGHALPARDPFLRRMFLPVLVTVEARDDNPTGAPSWGVSEPITLIPPAVGEPEANRYAALKGARDLAVDFWAWQSTERAQVEPQKRSAQERERARRVSAAMQEAVDESYGGLAVPTGLRAFLLGQMRVLERAPRAGESTQRKTEDVLLGIDVALRGLAVRDAQDVSKRLGDVAEEVADGAKFARESERSALGRARLESALNALGEGTRRLKTLGVLGADIGSVAEGDLARIRRARGQDDLFHTELAARHLAARLRRPNASFGSARRGGVESGAPAFDPQPGDASQASERFDQLAAELEELVREHGDEIGSVERALAEAEQSVSLDDLKEEAKRRADALREAIGQLPQTGDVPGSARAAASLGREHASSMAQSLERLALSDAVQSGRDATSALADARRKAKAPSSPSDWLDEDDVGDAADTIKRELTWAQEQLDRLKRQAEARAQGSLQKSGERERRHATRAGNLASRGKSGETALPKDALDALERAEGLMREAARALEQGRGDKGLELQREAQRLLERSDNGQTSDSDGEQDTPRQGEKDGKKDIKTGGDVPDTDDGKRALEFRQRVLRGLSKSKDGRLSPAVRRYAEGLLQ